MSKGGGGTLEPPLDWTSDKGLHYAYVCACVAEELSGERSTWDMAHLQVHNTQS